jgi:glycosyltransferase involved in cell wall biosynthesis
MATRFNPCLLIPVYDHEKPLPGLIARLKPYGLPCFVVDDGSKAGCVQVMRDLAAREPWLRYLRRDRNGGKGSAVKAGLRAAEEEGFSHAVQIDADGQHDPGDLGAFLAAANAHPEAVVTGRPLFDASVPKLRYYARYLTHVWVWINTVSFAIPDSMCGYRVYPVRPCVELLRSASLGDRMEFDTEILVRLYWRGVEVISLPTRVTYPEDGLSHFRPWRDNALISLMHARLFFGMLLRLPRLLGRTGR